MSLEIELHEEPRFERLINDFLSGRQERGSMDSIHHPSYVEKWSFTA